MDVKIRRIPVLHPVPSHICLVRQDQRRRDGVHRRPGSLIVMSDGCHYCEHIVNGQIKSPQDLKCQYRTAVGMIVPVHTIADIMHIPGDLRQFH